MPSTINDLPYETLSAILVEAAELNIKHGPQFTYGLSQAPEPLLDVRMQCVVRGQVSPDTLRWNATEAIRQVGRKWHDWAAEYALENLQIARWRGSERWMQSRTLDTIPKSPSRIAVYRDPYYSLRKTAQLLDSNPTLASCIRKIWFNGYYGAETNAMIFSILRRCNNLDYLTVPWTAFRYGEAEDWARLLGQNSEGRSITSLEFLAVDLKESQIFNAANQVDKKALDSPRVNLSGLKRLKIFGNSNFMPLTDDDLIAMSQTAANLREIHITGTATVGIGGIAALVDSSDETLEVLEHSPLTADGFAHPDLSSLQGQKGHPCRKILQCPRLRSLSLSLPSLCENLFTDYSVNWEGEMQIRSATVCGRHPLSLKTSDKARNQFWRTLDQARTLMSSRKKDGVELNIEIFIENWIFEPKRFLVHGNLELGETMSDGLWPSEKRQSGKGPYGQTGLYGKVDGPYECISEETFKAGLERRYISF